MGKLGGCGGFVGGDRPCPVEVEFCRGLEGDGGAVGGGVAPVNERDEGQAHAAAVEFFEVEHSGEGGIAFDGQFVAFAEDAVVDFVGGENVLDDEILGIDSLGADSDAGGEDVIFAEFVDIDDAEAAARVVDGVGFAVIGEVFAVEAAVEGVGGFRFGVEEGAVFGVELFGIEGLADGDIVNLEAFWAIELVEAVEEFVIEGFFGVAEDVERENPRAGGETEHDGQRDSPCEDRSARSAAVAPPSCAAAEKNVIWLVKESALRHVGLAGMGAMSGGLWVIVAGTGHGFGI